MGTVISLPCFWRRRRRCTTSPPTRGAATASIISHPRPLGTAVVSSANSVHGGGGSGRSIASATRGGGHKDLKRYDQPDRERDRGRSTSANTQFPGDDQMSGTTCASPKKTFLDILPESESEDTQDDAHVSTCLARGSPGLTDTTSAAAAVLDTTATATSCGANLLRCGSSHASHVSARSQSAASSSSGSGSGLGLHGSQRRRTAGRTAGSPRPGSPRRPGHKRTNSYGYGRNAHRAHSATHGHAHAHSHMYAASHSRTTARHRPLSATQADLVRNGSHGGFSMRSSASAAHRRRALRKVHRVENGWDYIRPVDLEGWDEKLGRNGRRVGVLG